MDNMKSARNKPFDGSNVDVNDEVQKLFRRSDTGKITNNFSKAVIVGVVILNSYFRVVTIIINNIIYESGTLFI